MWISSKKLEKNAYPHVHDLCIGVFYVIQVRFLIFSVKLWTIL